VKDVGLSDNTRYCLKMQMQSTVHLHFLQLCDQYNTANALTFIYLSHTQHISAINYSHRHAILQQSKRYTE